MRWRKEVEMGQAIVDSPVRRERAVTNRERIVDAGDDRRAPLPPSTTSKTCSSRRFA
jgi:hypothetical protein